MPTIIRYCIFIFQESRIYDPKYLRKRVPPISASSSDTQFTNTDFKSRPPKSLAHVVSTCTTYHLEHAIGGVTGYQQTCTHAMLERCTVVSFVIAIVTLIPMSAVLASAAVRCGCIVKPKRGCTLFTHFVNSFPVMSIGNHWIDEKMSQDVTLF